MGKERMGCKEILPLDAICYLERDTTNHIVQLNASEALGYLLKAVYIPEKTEGMLKSLQLAGTLVHDIRMFKLGCSMDIKAAEVSSAAMIRHGG